MAESMLYYVAKIREATSPLGILLNVDFLTDLLDEELKGLFKKRKDIES